MQREQSTKQHSRKKKPEKKSALTASRASRTRYSKQNRKHRKESVEQKSAPRRDRCPSPLHPGAHHQGEQRREAHLAEEERAVLQTGPQSRGQSQEGACQGRPAEEARPVQSTGTPLHAETGLPTAPMTTTTTTDHHRSIRHRTAPPQQEGEPTSFKPAPSAPRWNKRKTVANTSL